MCEPNLGPVVDRGRSGVASAHTVRETSEGYNVCTRKSVWPTGTKRYMNLSSSHLRHQQQNQCVFQKPNEHYLQQGHEPSATKVSSPTQGGLFRSLHTV